MACLGHAFNKWQRLAMGWEWARNLGCCDAFAQGADGVMVKKCKNRSWEVANGQSHRTGVYMVNNRASTFAVTRVKEM